MTNFVLYSGKMHEAIFFTVFILFILFVLFLDLLVIGRKSHELSFRESLVWSIVWISLGLLFFVFLWFFGHIIHGVDNPEQYTHIIDLHSHPLPAYDPQKGIEYFITLYNHNLAFEYLTGYVLEKSLSVDNIFVIILIFSSFGIELKYYKKVLFWGIIGAIVLRFLFIFVTGALIHEFDWILYIFGAFLVFSGAKIMLSGVKEEKIDNEKHPVVKLASRFFRVTPRHHGNFFERIGGKLFITPLFIVLLMVEFSDVVFAVDSIPAIFSVTIDPYIVFFSNIFAILGLRSLFFLVIKVIKIFRFLSYAISFLLVFIGVKIFLHSYIYEWGFTTKHSLIIVFSIIALGIILSVIIPEKKNKKIST